MIKYKSSTAGNIHNLFRDANPNWRVV